MERPTVDQPTALPTRKTAAFALSAVLAAALLSVAEKVAARSAWLDWLAADDVKSGLPILAGFLVAYIIRDRKT